MYTRNICQLLNTFYITFKLNNVSFLIAQLLLFSHYIIICKPTNVFNILVSVHVISPVSYNLSIVFNSSLKQSILYI